MLTSNVSIPELENYGIRASKINYQWSKDDLEKHILENKEGELSSFGAMNVPTGKFTGRSPKDRFFVKDNYTNKIVWWDGEINLPFDPARFDQLYEKMTFYLSGKELFVRDGYVCADSRYRLNIRTINECSYSNLFVNNMFLRLNENDFANFKEDWLIINAPNFRADPKVDGTRQENFSILNFEKKIALIGGTGYTGEMKKGIFTALNLTLPTEHDVLPMHCSANVGEQGDTAIFFGLSGTGKTTLSTSATRKLIGDDEHGWTNDGVIFNFEGGCYAKVIDLEKDKEPEIYGAIKSGALLENCVFKEGTNEVDFSNTSITQNTRVSYPIHHIDNIATPSLAKNPKNIFFLTFDAFGVLPPIAKLNANQAAYHFISGYTSKVAGTEAGVSEPQTVFSACFGAPFMPLHPTKYAEMLSAKIDKHNTNVWMVNTGLNGTGKRMSLKHTRAVINAAINGDLDNVEFQTHSIFEFDMPLNCPEVPSELLLASNSWDDKDAFRQKALLLAEKFEENFKQFESQANAEILSGGPKK